MSEKFSEGKKDMDLRLSGRVPLKVVVAVCEKQWFENALKAAKCGEVEMQSLVGQMFSSGYGVAVDAKQVNASLCLIEYICAIAQLTFFCYLN
jgi:hypothetical protein